MSDSTENIQTKPNLGMQAAKASWVAPITAVFLNIVSSGPYSTALQKTIIGFTSLGIYAIGLGLGIFALMQVRRYGREGIFGPAIAGVLINGLLVLAFAVVICAALARQN